MTVYTKEEFEKMFKDMIEQKLLLCVNKIEAKDQYVEVSAPAVVTLEIDVSFNGYITDL